MSIVPLSDLYRRYADLEEAFAGMAKVSHVKAWHERSRDKWLQLAAQAV